MLMERKGGPFDTTSYFQRDRITYNEKVKQGVAVPYPKEKIVG